MPRADTIQPGARLEGFIGRTATVMAVIAATATALLMLFIVADVVFRNLRGASLPGMVELAESCMVVTVFFGLAHVAVRGEHIAMAIVESRLPLRLRRRIAPAVWGLSAGIVGWMLIASVGRAVAATRNGETRFGIVSWPLWPTRWAIVLGLAALLLVLVVNVLRTVSGRPALGAETGEG